MFTNKDQKGFCDINFRADFSAIVLFRAKIVGNDAANLTTATQTQDVSVAGVLKIQTRKQ